MPDRIRKCDKRGGLESAPGAVDSAFPHKGKSKGRLVGSMITSDQFLPRSDFSAKSAFHPIAEIPLRQCNQSFVPIAFAISAEP